MTKKTRAKKVQSDTLHVFVVDLREVMLARDDDTLCTERELAARIVNGMMMSLAVRDDAEHTHVALLGMQGDGGVSHEGCQKDIVSTAKDYNGHVKGVNVREFLTGNGICKLNCPIWLQAPFEDGTAIALDADLKAPLWQYAIFDILSKWQKHPVNLVFVTSKNRVPDLDAFMDFMSTLVTNGFPRLEWGVIDTSEWRMFDPIVHFIPLETTDTAKVKGEK